MTFVMTQDSHPSVLPVRGVRVTGMETRSCAHLYMGGCGLCRAPLTAPAPCFPRGARCRREPGQMFSEWHVGGRVCQGPSQIRPGPRVMGQKKCHATFLPASLLWRFMRARLDEAPLLLSRTSTNDCEKATP